MRQIRFLCFFGAILLAGNLLADKVDPFTDKNVKSRVSEYHEDNLGFLFKLGAHYNTPTLEFLLDHLVDEYTPQQQLDTLVYAIESGHIEYIALAIAREDIRNLIGAHAEELRLALNREGGEMRGLAEGLAEGLSAGESCQVDDKGDESECQSRQEEMTLYAKQQLGLAVLGLSCEFPLESFVKASAWLMDNAAYCRDKAAAVTSASSQLLSTNKVLEVDSVAVRTSCYLEKSLHPYCNLLRVKLLPASKRSLWGGETGSFHEVQAYWNVAERNIEYAYDEYGNFVKRTYTPRLYRNQ
ncbi:hypothetical protein EOPP23_16305 [Endozoicomonas sp. OPT23]|uniref:hypothetical protein n=1 Tax=Endozoicomonas sp. OPT23 TaxID=2072845 RepID=UPI00129BB934|nr:hypothetical protein [Endozoicomonas sp. OPT23]MRI34549.1 hypothetical protein [Endozoicomonas sp. OPT23]